MSGITGQEKKKLDMKNKALAKYKHKHNRFEIIVNPDIAFKLRMKQITWEEIDILEILEIDAIFKDASKGLRATTEDLIDAFETEDEIEIAKIILKKGELQLTQNQRKELADQKRKQIINFISKHAVDPKLNIPHPPARIENALEVGNIKILLGFCPVLAVGLRLYFKIDYWIWLNSFTLIFFIWKGSIP